MSAVRMQRLLVTTVVALVLALAPAAEACTVCMGDNNSNVAGAANAAIFLMLGALGLMFIATAAVAFYLYKRARTPLPPHLALVEGLQEDADE